MKTKNSSIIFFLTRSLFSGFGLSYLYDITGKDTYIGMFIGIFIGLLVMFLYSKIIELKKDQSLKLILKKHPLLGVITRICLIFASILILIYALIIYNIFIVGFLLTNSPEIYVTIPFIVLATYCAYKGLKVINRFSNSLMAISLVFIIIIIASLGTFIETTNLLPILTTKSTSLIEVAIFFAGISTFPNILILHTNIEAKNIIKMYLASSLSLVLAAFFVSGVLGNKLINIFRFPEYMVLKQIKLFQFIEKIENVLSVVWILDLFITVLMAIYSLKELLPAKKNKVWTILLLIITTYFIDKVFAFNYVYELKLYYMLPFIALIIPFIILILMFITLKNKRSTKHQQYNKHHHKLTYPS